MRKILLLGRRVHATRAESGFYRALARRFSLTVSYCEDGWPERAADVPDYRRYDAWIWWVPFRRLIERSPFDWQDFPGLRVMYDPDVHANYHRMVPSEWIGLWPAEFRRQRFDLLVATGRETCDRLLADGVNAGWLPKAYDPERFFDQGGRRAGVCFFGARYLAREVMLQRLQRAGVAYEGLTCRYEQLNHDLNRFRGALICNLEGTVRRGFSRLLHGPLSRWATSIRPGFEPMLKNFEVAGAGCAPIADWIDELSELGFIDGESLVAYRSFDGLIDRLRHYADHPDGLDRIGARAGELARERHTWDHRATQLESLLSTVTH